MDEGQETQLPVNRQSLWLVYKWEGLKPLSAYFKAEQTPPTVLWPWAKSKRTELNARHKMIRQAIELWCIQELDVVSGPFSGA